MSSQASVQNDVSEIKEKTKDLLKRLGLAVLVSIEEMEGHLSQYEKMHESPLFLGLLTRAIESGREKTIEELVSLLGSWKNFIPQKDLCGLSPAEYDKKYPKGPEELSIMADLLDAFGDDIRKLSPEENNEIDKKLRLFEDNFLKLVPVRQPFPVKDKMLSNREIILEERRHLKHPEDRRQRVRLFLFADSLGANIGQEIERLDEQYLKAMDELITMQTNPNKRNFKKTAVAFVSMKEIEPYMKCRKDSFRFYLNMGNAAFLTQQTEEAICCYKKALVIRPNYKEARETLKRIESFLSCE
ncbi:MAG: tetratricopeptide repeat protein [bacterium]|nr:tetratricopeptide repeat protein [bacterium]